MKNKKIKLSELKIKSFVTEEGLNNAQTVKGGARSSQHPTPATWCFHCPPATIDDNPY